MLTQIVANRVYDFSHQVGGREIQGDVAVAVGPGDDFYLVVRNLPQMVVRLTIGTVPGDEEIVGQFGSKGDGDGIGYIFGQAVAPGDSRQMPGRGAFLYDRNQIIIGQHGRELEDRRRHH